MSTLMKKCDEMQAEIYRLRQQVLKEQDQTLGWMLVVALVGVAFGVVMFGVGWHAARSAMGGLG